MDLYRRYGALGAAGDRHLAEFMDGRRYLGDKAAPERWLYHLTDVAYRKADQRRKTAEAEARADGRMPVTLKKSDEELISFLKALLGLGRTVSNANVMNAGQMGEAPPASVVETLCVFDRDSVTPLPARPLPREVGAMVEGNARNIEDLYGAIRSRDLEAAFRVFLRQPLCSRLDRADGRDLFGRMLLATADRLAPWYDIETWTKRT